MPETIRRDVGAPYDELDPVQKQEFDEFMVPPDTMQIFDDLVNEDPTSRAMRLFRPELVDGLVLPPPPDNPDAVVPPLNPGFLPTPDRVAAQVLADHRGLHDFALPVPGRANVPVWSFRDNLSGQATWPAATIRVKEGQMVHSKMSNRNGPHTIHHHGIEPTPANDGVGHLTFDVGGGVVYDYQWLPTEAGTYFYHCHVNTVLHFEMGMYGLLIVDAPKPAAAAGPDAPYQDGGPGWTHVGNNLAAYQKEAFWVADDIDTRWHANAVHGHSREAGISPGEFMAITDPRRRVDLHDFRPDVFVVSGVPAPWSSGQTVDNSLIQLNPDAGSIITPRVARGQKVLIRTLNASYTTSRWTFPAALRSSAQVIAMDGRTLGREPFGRYSSPFLLSQMATPYFQLSTAQRYDILLDTTNLAAGNHDVTIDYHHWITDVRIKRVRTRIIVTA